MTTPNTTPTDSTDPTNRTDDRLGAACISVAVRRSDDGDDDEEGDADVPPIPECPDCGAQDARQLSTGEWVCQECTCVYERGDA